MEKKHLLMGLGVILLIVLVGRGVFVSAGVGDENNDWCKGGDMNMDGSVDFGDLMLWMRGDVRGDANKDGSVDFADFNIWRSEEGPCSGSTVCYDECTKIGAPLICGPFKMCDDSPRELDYHNVDVDNMMCNFVLGGDTDSCLATADSELDRWHFTKGDLLCEFCNGEQKFCDRVRHDPGTEGEVEVCAGKDACECPDGGTNEKHFACDFDVKMCKWKDVEDGDVKCDPTDVNACLEPLKFHYKCEGVKCVAKNGEGNSECNPDLNGIGGSNVGLNGEDESNPMCLVYHNECNSDYECKPVLGPGEDECKVDSDCNEAPSVESVELIEDPWEKWPNHMRVWITYSMVFEEPLTCKFVVTDDDEHDRTLKVNVKFVIDATGRQFDRVLEYTKSVTCTSGVECKVNLPKEYVWPSDVTRCEITVTDKAGESDSGSSNVISMPSFDLIVKDLKLINTVDSGYSIARKPYVLKAWPVFNSDMIDELDRDVRGEFEVSIKDSVGVDFKETKKYRGSGRIKPEYDVDVTKQAAIQNGPNALILNGVEAIKVLREVKNAEDSWEFVNEAGLNSGFLHYLYGKVDMSGNGEIKESNEKNNEWSIFGGVIREQKKNYKIAYVFIPSFNLQDNDIEGAEQFFMASYDYLIAASPLRKDKTNALKLDGIPYYYDWTDLAKKDNKARRDAAKLRIKLIEEFLEPRREALGVDLIVGIVMDQNVMLGDVGGAIDAITLKKSRFRSEYYKVVLLRNGAKVSTLLHELGHIYVTPMEDYNEDDLGHAIEEQGWWLDQGIPQSYYVAQRGSKRNIWTEPNIGGRNANDEDEPEHISFVFPRRASELWVGEKRFINIMGDASTEGTWINMETYKAFLDALRSYFEK